MLHESSNAPAYCIVPSLIIDEYLPSSSGETNRVKRVFRRNIASSETPFETFDGGASNDAETLTAMDVTTTADSNNMNEEKSTESHEEKPATPIFAEVFQHVFSISYLQTTEEVVFPYLKLAAKSDATIKDIISFLDSNIKSKSSLSCRLWDPLDSSNLENSESIASPQKFESSYSDVSLHGNILIQDQLRFISKRTAYYVEVSLKSCPKYNDWPLYKELHDTWVGSLSAGTYVDALDRTKAWLPAMIHSQTENNGVVVKFRGWSEKFNEKFDHTSIYQKILPTFTVTQNWRAALTVGSEIDMKVEIQTNDARWIPGKILNINRLSQIIECTPISQSQYLKKQYFFFIQDDGKATIHVDF